MSYIRSGGNPEKLYIYGTEDRAYICEGSKPDWWIPLNIFNGLLRRYHRYFHDCPREYKGAKVDNVWVDKDNIEKDESLYIPSPDYLLECKVKLSYGENCVYMWDVTWEYIVQSFILRIEKNKRVYVQWDPLYEKVLCVHEKPNKRCKVCKKAEKDGNGYQRGTYQIEEKSFSIVPDYNLLKL